MLKNIYLEIEYEGTNYYGWQIQNTAHRLPTVQEELEKALEKLFKKKIRVISSGRTDKGVHAKAQVINFKVETSILLSRIKKALNSFLPEDIYIKKIKKVDLDFHARFGVKSRVYRYVILNRKEPDIFLRNYTWWLPQKLDLEKMKRLSLKLVGKRDFSLFAQSAGLYKSTEREIKRIEIKRRRWFISIDIEADGFLRGMVRNIVGFLVEVGLGKISLAEAYFILKENRRELLGKSAPAKGLYLWKVFY